MGNIFSKPLNLHSSFDELMPKYTLHVDDKIVNLKNDRLLMVIKIEGINFESLNDRDIQDKNNSINRIVTDITNQYPDQVQFHANVIRSKIHANANYKFPSPFVQKFHDKYIERFNKQDYFETGFYLSIVFKYDNFEQAILDLREIESIIVPILSDWQPHVLRTYKRVNGIRVKDIFIEDEDTEEEIEAKEKYIEFVHKNGVTYSEIQEYLGFLINLKWQPVPVSAGFITNSLPEVELFFGHDIVEIRHSDYRKWATCLDLKDFPETTKVGMFDLPILDQKFEFILNFSFLGMNKHRSKALIQDKLNQFQSVGDKATYQQQELDAALGHIASGSVCLGVFNASAVCLGNSTQEAHKNASAFRSLFLKESATIFNKVSLSAPISYFSILPAQDTLARPVPKSSRVFSSVFCMHSYATGKAFFNPLGDGTAIMPIETESKNLYHFNFHATAQHENRIGQPDAGHTLIFGTTGSGKSVLQCALQSFATRFDCQIFALDKDRSMELFIRSLGGDYFLLRDGERTGLNPFQFEVNPSPKLKLFVAKLVCSLVREHEGYLSASDEEKITAGVNTIFEMEFKDRRLGYIIQTLPEELDNKNSLVTRLNKWVGNGLYAWVLDNPVNTFDTANFKYVGFDLTSILVKDNPVTEPVLACLFFLKDKMLMKGISKQIPTFFSVEEYWLPANIPLTSDPMKNSLKVGRKLLECMILITQQPEDATECLIAATVKQQTVTKIFLPNPSADKEGYMSVGLTEKEFLRVKELDQNSRVFLVKQNGKAAFARLNLNGFNDELAVFSAQAKTLNAIDELMDDEEYSQYVFNKQPEKWLPKFFKMVRSDSTANYDLEQFKRAN
ncbi:MAG: hypothetical protein AB7V48_16280 [Sedimentibacter sp.]